MTGITRIFEWIDEKNGKLIPSLDRKVTCEDCAITIDNIKFEDKPFGNIIIDIDGTVRATRGKLFADEKSFI